MRALLRGNRLRSSGSQVSFETRRSTPFIVYEAVSHSLPEVLSCEQHSRDPVPRDFTMALILAAAGATVYVISEEYESIRLSSVSAPGARTTRLPLFPYLCAKLRGSSDPLACLYAEYLASSCIATSPSAPVSLNCLSRSAFDDMVTSRAISSTTSAALLCAAVAHVARTFIYRRSRLQFFRAVEVRPAFLRLGTLVLCSCLATAGAHVVEAVTERQTQRQRQREASSKDRIDTVSIQQSAASNIGSGGAASTMMQPIVDASHVLHPLGEVSDLCAHAIGASPSSLCGCAALYALALLAVAPRVPSTSIARSLVALRRGGALLPTAAAVSLLRASLQWDVRKAMRRTRDDVSSEALMRPVAAIAPDYASSSPSGASSIAASSLASYPLSAGVHSLDGASDHLRHPDGADGAGGVIAGRGVVATDGPRSNDGPLSNDGTPLILGASRHQPTRHRQAAHQLRRSPPPHLASVTLPPSAATLMHAAAHSTSSRVSDGVVTAVAMGEDVRSFDHIAVEYAVDHPVASHDDAAHAGGALASSAGGGYASYAGGGYASYADGGRVPVASKWLGRLQKVLSMGPTVTSSYSLLRIACILIALMSAAAWSLKRAAYADGTVGSVAPLLLSSLDSIRVISDGDGHHVSGVVGVDGCAGSRGGGIDEGSSGGGDGPSDSSQAALAASAIASLLSRTVGCRAITVSDMTTAVAQLMQCAPTASTGDAPPALSSASLNALMNDTTGALVAAAASTASDRHAAAKLRLAGWELRMSGGVWMLMSHKASTSTTPSSHPIPSAAAEVPQCFAVIPPAGCSMNQLVRAARIPQERTRVPSDGVCTLLPPLPPFDRIPTSVSSSSPSTSHGTTSTLSASASLPSITAPSQPSSVTISIPTSGHTPYHSRLVRSVCDECLHPRLPSRATGSDAAAVVIEVASHQQRQQQHELHVHRHQHQHQGEHQREHQPHGIHPTPIGLVPCVCTPHSRRNRKDRTTSTGSSSADTSPPPHTSPGTSTAKASSRGAVRVASNSAAAMASRALQLMDTRGGVAFTHVHEMAMLLSGGGGALWGAPRSSTSTGKGGIGGSGSGGGGSSGGGSSPSGEFALGRRVTAVGEAGDTQSIDSNVGANPGASRPSPATVCSCSLLGISSLRFAAAAASSGISSPSPSVHTTTPFSFRNWIPPFPSPLSLPYISSAVGSVAATLRTVRRIVSPSASDVSALSTRIAEQKQSTAQSASDSAKHSHTLKQSLAPKQQQQQQQQQQQPLHQQLLGCPGAGLRPVAHAAAAAYLDRTVPPPLSSSDASSRPMNSSSAMHTSSPLIASHMASFSAASITAAEAVDDRVRQAAATASKLHMVGHQLESLAPLALLPLAAAVAALPAFTTAAALPAFTVKVTSKRHRGLGVAALAEAMGEVRRGQRLFMRCTSAQMGGQAAAAGAAGAGGAGGAVSAAASSAASAPHHSPSPLPPDHASDRHRDASHTVYMSPAVVGVWLCAAALALALIQSLDETLRGAAASSLASKLVSSVAHPSLDSSSASSASVGQLLRHHSALAGLAAIVPSHRSLPLVVQVSRGHGDASAGASASSSSASSASSSSSWCDGSPTLISRSSALAGVFASLWPLSVVVLSSVAAAAAAPMASPRVSIILPSPLTVRGALSSTSTSSSSHASSSQHAATHTVSAQLGLSSLSSASTSSDALGAARDALLSASIFHPTLMTNSPPSPSGALSSLSSTAAAAAVMAAATAAQPTQWTLEAETRMVAALMAVGDAEGAKQLVQLRCAARAQEAALSTAAHQLPVERDDPSAASATSAASASTSSSHAAGGLVGDASTSGGRSSRNPPSFPSPSPSPCAIGDARGRSPPTNDGSSDQSASTVPPSVSFPPQSSVSALSAKASSHASSAAASSSSASPSSSASTASIASSSHALSPLASSDTLRSPGVKPLLTVVASRAAVTAASLALILSTALPNSMRAAVLRRIEWVAAVALIAMSSDASASVCRQIRQVALDITCSTTYADATDTSTTKVRPVPSTAHLQLTPSDLFAITQGGLSGASPVLELLLRKGLVDVDHQGHVVVAVTPSGVAVGPRPSTASSSPSAPSGEGAVTISPSFLSTSTSAPPPRLAVLPGSHVPLPLAAAAGTLAPSLAVPVRSLPRLLVRVASILSPATRTALSQSFVVSPNSQSHQPITTASPQGGSYGEVAQPISSSHSGHGGASAGAQSSTVYLLRAIALMIFGAPLLLLATDGLYHKQFLARRHRS